MEQTWVTTDNFWTGTHRHTQNMLLKNARKWRRKHWSTFSTHAELIINESADYERWLCTIIHSIGHSEVLLHGRRHQELDRRQVFTASITTKIPTQKNWTKINQCIAHSAKRLNDEAMKPIDWLIEIISPRTARSSPQAIIMIKHWKARQRQIMQRGGFPLKPEQAHIQTIPITKRRSMLCSSRPIKLARRIVLSWKCVQNQSSYLQLPEYRT